MSILELMLSGTIFLSGLTDILRKINFGSITALGLLTIALAATSWLLVLTRPKLPKVVLITSWLVLFLLLAFVSWLCHYKQLNSTGVIQNISVYVAFVGVTILSIKKSNETTELPKYISKTLPRTIQISLLLYLLSIPIGGFGSNAIASARAFALFAIIGIAWYLAAWRYRLPGGMKWTAIAILAVALSYSRTALLIGLILFPLSQMSLTSSKALLRMVLTILLILIVSYLAFNYVEPIRDRFTQTGDNATVGGVTVNTSGRGQAWPLAFASAMKSPWIGQGPGSVSVYLLKAVGSEFSHPHNDYLRLFHDYGIIGLTMWLGGYLTLIFTTWRNWLWADKNNRANAHVHLAAFLALVAIALGMITDNVVVYIFSMAPLGILVGASIGNGKRCQKLLRKQIYGINVTAQPLPISRR